MQVIEKIFNILSKTIYLIYLYALGIVLPLYFDDAYFNMMEAKANIFLLFAKIMAVPLCALLIIKIILKKNEKSKLSFLLIIFLLSTFLSTIFSLDIQTSLDGSLGWHAGLYCISFIILSILSLKDVRIKRGAYIPLIVVNIFIYLCAILHGFEIDVLNLHQGILDVSYHKYATTLGNINWYTGYLSLTVMSFIGLYLNSKDKYKYLYLLASSLGIISIALLGSDGIFLGMGLVSFFAVPMIFKDRETIKRFSITVIIFVIGLLVARYLDYCMDGYAALLRRRLVILPLIVLSISLLIFSVFISDQKYLNIKNKLIILFEVLIFVIFIIFILIAVNKEDAEWGTGRIALFSDSLKIFNNFTPFRKIFGIGLEQLYQIYRPINERYDGIYLSSHSEWIQALLTGGFIMFFSYLACWIYLIVVSIKKRLWNTNIAYIVLGLGCYLGQSLVNSATVPNVAILSILLILFFNNN